MNALVRALAWLIALTLVALPVVAVVNGWFASDRWPIQRLQLTAEFQRVSAEQVRGAVATHLAPGFFAVDLSAVRAAVAALPWVAEVEVRKRWPDVLDVRLVEHRAVARWQGDRLVSERGDLFVAPGAEAMQGLPELTGPDQRVAEVLAFHASALEALGGSGIVPRGAGVSARGSWTLTLEDGARVMLGRSDVPVRLQRLARHLPAVLAAQPVGPERIDFRYSNGFALRWREPAAAATAIEKDT